MESLPGSVQQDGDGSVSPGLARLQQQLAALDEPPPPLNLLMQINKSEKGRSDH